MLVDPVEPSSGYGYIPLGDMDIFLQWIWIHIPKRVSLGGSARALMYFYVPCASDKCKTVRSMYMPKIQAKRVGEVPGQGKGRIGG
jgi:hypothetical protein